MATPPSVMLGTQSRRTSSLLPTSPPKSQFPPSPFLPLDTQLSPVTPLFPLDTNSRHLPPYPAFRDAQPKPQISPISRKKYDASRPHFLPLAFISVKIPPAFPVNFFRCHTSLKSGGGGGGIYTITVHISYFVGTPTFSASSPPRKPAATQLYGIEASGNRRSSVPGGHGFEPCRTRLAPPIFLVPGVATGLDDSSSFPSHFTARNRDAT